MSNLTQDHVVSALHPHLAALREISLGGWQDYLNEYSDKQRMIHCPTTRAGIVHDHQVERASVYASQTEGVWLHDLSKLKLLAIETSSGMFAVRLKKVDEELKSANVGTGQVRNFRNQENLFDFASTLNLELGYRLNNTATEIIGIYLICPSGNGYAWFSEIKAAGVENIVENLYEHRSEKNAVEAEADIHAPAEMEEDEADVVPRKEDSETEELQQPKT